MNFTQRSFSSYKALINKKIQITNLISLGIVQGSNFLIPILLYPHLYKIVGSEHFGSVVYGMTLMLYFSSIIDFGYTIEGARRIAITKFNHIEFSKTISVIYNTKIKIFIVCSLLIASLYFISKFRIEYKLYVFSIIYLFGNTVLPTWIFQGLEKMSSFTITNLIFKLLSMALVFLLIKHKHDYVLFMPILGLGNIATTITLFVQVRNHNIIYYKQTFDELKKELKSSMYFFLTSISSVLFANSNIFIISNVLTKHEVGKYGLVEKIAFAGWQLVTVFSQFTYPIICRGIEVKTLAISKFIRIMMYSFTLLTGVYCLLIYNNASKIVEMATSETNEEMINLLKILSFVPLVVSANVLPNQSLLSTGNERYTVLALNISILFTIITCTLLTLKFGIVGSAWAVLSSQIVLTLLLNGFYLRRRQQL